VLLQELDRTLLGFYRYDPHAPNLATAFLISLLVKVLSGLGTSSWETFPLSLVLGVKTENYWKFRTVKGSAGSVVRIGI